MDPLSLLKQVEGGIDFRRAISASALFWAFSSILALLLKQFGLLNSYLDALPFVIIISWMGAEIAARLPSRLPIAYCSQCRKVHYLPNLPLRQLWPWKRCINCRSKLHYICENGHLLSVFEESDIETIGEKKDQTNTLYCIKCGVRVGGKMPVEEFDERLSTDEFLEYIKYLANVSIQPELKVMGGGTTWSSREPTPSGKLYLLHDLRKIISATELEAELREPLDKVQGSLEEARLKLKNRRVKKISEQVEEI